MGVRFPPDLRDEDQPHLGLLSETPIRPIFILGLHRSGTTWLYESMAATFGLGSVTLHEVFCFPRLLARQLEGRASEDQAEIDAYLTEHGLATRGIDDIGLSHATVEEYGWILQRYGGSLKVTPRTKRVLDRLIQKVQHQAPDAPAVLLKNPWDTSNAATIAELYPEAKFVFIARDPVRIAQSQYKNSLIFGGADVHFLMMLMQGFWLGRFVIGCQRLLWRLLGQHLYSRITVRWILGDVSKELAGYRAAYAALPAERKIEVTYSELSGDPSATLTRVGEFLGFAPDPSALAAVTPRVRAGPLHPQIERVAVRFRERLERLGLLRTDV
ncbi:MAG: sulfotransferase [Planctomycetes bacterium]|nr:sulfotransferase [Planctomycetota bacterium]